ESSPRNPADIRGWCASRPACRACEIRDGPCRNPRRPPVNARATSPHCRRRVNGTRVPPGVASRRSSSALPSAAPAPPRGHERWPMDSLRTLLPRAPIVVAPGCYDALSALMIERGGFPAAYFSGASLAYTRFGRPDIGLIAMDEVVDTVAAVR